MMIDSMTSLWASSRSNWVDTVRVLLICFAVSVVGVALAWVTSSYSPAISLAAIVGILVGPYLVKNPHIPLLFTLIFLPMDGIDHYFPKGFSAGKILSLVTLACYSCAFLVSRYRYNLLGGSHTPLIALFMLIIVIGLFDAKYPSETINSMGRFLRLIILYMMVWNLIQTPRRFQWFLSFMVIGVAISAGYGVYGFFTSPLRNYRAVGLTAQPNILGNWTTLMFPITFAFALAAPKRWMRWVMAAIAALIIFGLIVSFSRGSVIATLVVLPITLWRLSRRYFVRIIIVLFLFATVAVPLIPGRFYDRFAALDDPTEDRSIFRRQTYLFFAQRVLIERPWVGVGLSNFEELYAQSEYRVLLDEKDQVRGRAAHNTYVHLAIETGLLGAGVFVGMLVLAWRNLLVSQKRMKHANDMLTYRLIQGLECSLLSFFLLCLFGSRQYEEMPWLFFGLSSALLTMSAQHRYPKALMPT